LDESRRLELLEQRLGLLTKRRIQRLEVRKGARCLEIGGGRGSITRWLSYVVGSAGRVIATDLQLGFLTKIDAPNVEVLRRDIRTAASALRRASADAGVPGGRRPDPRRRTRAVRAAVTR
jgi:precorrin-6B methylase 2